MRYRLDLALKPAEGALIRVIGMVERRGFAPREVHAVPAANGWQVQITAQGGARAPETLRQQLLKVYDVESVQITALDNVAGVSVSEQAA